MSAESDIKFQVVEQLRAEIDQTLATGDMRMQNLAVALGAGLLDTSRRAS